MEEHRVLAKAELAREADNVVNLASRIAAHAQPGEVLLPIDDARPATGWDDAGEAALKGLPQPVVMARVR